MSKELVKDERLKVLSVSRIGLGKITPDQERALEESLRKANSEIKPTVREVITGNEVVIAQCLNTVRGTGFLERYKFQKEVR